VVYVLARGAAVIYTIGDSHAYYTFAGVKGTKNYPMGPVSMKRIGSGRVRKYPPPEMGLFLSDEGVTYGEDTVLVDMIRKINPKPGDTLILSCGEADVRCFIKPQLDGGADLDTLLRSMVDAYIERAASLETNGARVALASITPPTTRARASSFRFPAAGTDEERVLYTRTLNALLSAGCPKRGLLFVDTYADFSDADGMLRLDLADRNVHVRQTVESMWMIHGRLVAMGIAPALVKP